jgi:hypothetical protein
VVLTVVLEDVAVSGFPCAVLTVVLEDVAVSGFPCAVLTVVLEDVVRSGRGPAASVLGDRPGRQIRATRVGSVGGGL